VNARLRIAVVTVARSDYGGLRPVLAKIASSPALELLLIVGGAHLEPRFGQTEHLIVADGFGIAARVPMDLNDSSAAGAGRSAARAHAGYVEAYAQLNPDVLMVYGDRFEMHAAAVAAVPFGLPVAHLHGGELTFGAFDDSLRHSITKLSHLHFAAAEAYRVRIIQMGEEPWRVQTTGGPGIDAILNVPALDVAALQKLLGMTLDPAPVLITMHPTTLLPEATIKETEALLAALARIDRPIVFTAPNADPGNNDIRSRIERFVAAHANARLIENLDTPGYVGLMRIAAAMVGNSSSGLIEAPSFALPVVNIGERQAGRLRARNVIDVVGEQPQLEGALRQAIDPRFRVRLAGCVNPYGDGHAAERIVARLEQREPRERLVAKRFYDLDAVPARRAGA
jgi:UDP-hydrolysing UDP-N-acetyl-D-glucosamine 2-epimerase